MKGSKMRMSKCDFLVPNFFPYSAGFLSGLFFSG